MRQNFWGKGNGMGSNVKNEVCGIYIKEFPGHWVHIMMLCASHVTTENGLKTFYDKGGVKKKSLYNCHY